MNEYIQTLELELKSRGFSRKTVKSYMFHVSCFLNHAGTESSKEDIQRYFVGLSERLDPRTVNLRISAVKFFYRQVLLKDFDIKYMKRPKRIPEVLTKEETVAILNQITNPKHRLLIETIYGCGLRVSEAVCLKKADLRFDEGLIMIKQSKGRKDRFVTLPKLLSSRLKAYFETRADENPYVFDSNRGSNLTVKSVQLIVQNAAKKTKISKQIHVHTLRHSYATHLLEQGTDLRIIQRLLGHSSVRTTEIYTHISNQLIKNVVSPPDCLNSTQNQMEPSRNTNQDKISHNTQRGVSFTNKTS